MKENPHRTGVGANGRSTPTAQNIIAACPYANACAIRWHSLPGTETAECSFCYQVLDRADLYRIMAGPPR